MIGEQRGGFLPNITHFDRSPFKKAIKEEEVPFIDPQQRLLLEVVWEALEDAGRPVQRENENDENEKEDENEWGDNAGVFVGISRNDYAFFSSGTSLNGYV